MPTINHSFTLCYLTFLIISYTLGAINRGHLTNPHVLLDMGANWRTWRNPMESQRKRANSTLAAEIRVEPAFLVPWGSSSASSTLLPPLFDFSALLWRQWFNKWRLFNAKPNVICFFGYLLFCTATAHLGRICLQTVLIMKWKKGSYFICQ